MNVRGITLISLVITIIILLILTAISLNFIVGSEGLFQKTDNAVNKTKIATAEEKIELRITEIAIDKIEKEYRKLELVDLLEIENYDITVQKNQDNTIYLEGDYAIVECDGFKFKVYEDGKIELYKEKKDEEGIENHLVDYWKLENSLDNVKINRQGLEIFKGQNLTFEDGSAHIENTVLATTEDYLFPNNFTITYDYKKTSIVGCTLILGKVNNIRKPLTHNGIMCWNREGFYYSVYNGGSYKDYVELGEFDEFVNLSYTFDGIDYSLYRNGEIIEKLNGYNDLKYKLIIGGTYCSGVSDAGFNWGYANGYFKNIKVFDIALTAEQIKKVNNITN